MYKIKILPESFLNLKSIANKKWKANYAHEYRVFLNGIKAKRIEYFASYFNIKNSLHIEVEWIEFQNKFIQHLLENKYCVRERKFIEILNLEKFF